MIRTKYLVVSIFLCLLTIVVAGGFSVMPRTLSDNTIETTTIFAIPQDSYEIVKWSDTAKDSTRRAFIDRVRDSIEQDPVTTLQRAPVPVEEREEETLSAPSPEERVTSEQTSVTLEPITSVVVTPMPDPEVVPAVTTTPSTDSESQTEKVEEQIPVI
jgi:hypothetical protein